MHSIFLDVCVVEENHKGKNIVGEVKSMCCDMSASMKLSVSDSFVHVSNDAQLLMIECFAYNSSETQHFCLIYMYWRGKD